MIANSRNSPHKWSVGAVILFVSLSCAAAADGHSAEKDESNLAPMPAAKAPVQEPVDRQGRERVLHFPTHRSLGSLYIQDAAMDQIPEHNDWEGIGPAMGDVIIPAGKRVRLFVGDEAALKNLSSLRRLRPDDLHNLTIRVPNVPPTIKKAESVPDIDADEMIMPYLSSLTGLRILDLNYVTITHSGLQIITGLESLRSLGVMSAATPSGPTPKSKQLAYPSLEQLARLKSLETLWLASADIGDTAVEQLAKVTSLREITLWRSNVLGPGLAHLAKLPSLERLGITGPNITDATLKYMSKLVSLKELALRDTAITDAGLAHLSNLFRLQDLDLSDTHVTDQGLIHLKSLRALKKLNLEKWRRPKGEITDEGMVHLKKIKSLEYLDLPPESVTDKGLVHLSELSNLRHLSLPIRWYLDPSRYTTYYTDEGLSALARLALLEELDIAGPGVTDVGMCHIARLTKLRGLTLFGCPVTKEGLAKLTSMKSLNTLSLYAPNITVADLAQVNEMPSLTQLDVDEIEKGNSVLNLAGLTQLEDLSISLKDPSAFRDDDLACVGKMTRLKRLRISPQEYSDAGLKHLAGLTSLETLEIGGPHLTDDGLSCLVNMSKLDFLVITDGDFTDKGLRHLEGLQRLWFLSITSQNAFSEAALDRLPQKLPNLHTLRIVP